jgi:hypothetical protein
MSAHSQHKTAQAIAHQQGASAEDLAEAVRAVLQRIAKTMEERQRRRTSLAAMRTVPGRSMKRLSVCMTTRPVIAATVATWRQGFRSDVSRSLIVAGLFGPDEGLPESKDGNAGLS